MSEEESSTAASRPLIRAMSHPVQAKIVICLTEGIDASAKQIADRSDTPLRSVRHHLGSLEKNGIVERTASRKRRGVHQHYYRLVQLPYLALKHAEALSPAERGRVSMEALKISFASVSVSLAAGVFDKRPDRCLTHTRMQVDIQGWRELVQLHERTWEEAERIKAEAAQRLGAGVERIRAASTLMFFELPPLEERD